MKLGSTEALQIIRRLLNDAKGGRRLGENWSDDEIRACFTRHYYDNLLDYVRNGVCHYAASMLRVIVVGPDTINYDATNPANPFIYLPNDFLCGVSAGVEGRNIPIYHLLDVDITIVPAYPEDVRDFGLYIYSSNSGPVARPFFDATHPNIPAGKYMILTYLTNEFRLGSLQSMSQLYSWYVYQNSILDTVAELMEYDAGSEGSPILSIIRSLRLPINNTAIQLNGSLRNIPTVISR
jgi:hypothetical protein